MCKSNSIFYALIVAIVILLCFGYLLVAQAQNWVALPPYNTLWPLWSPALSPIDTITGLATPLIFDLFPDTLLPVEPGLTWNPALTYPWLLYNSPLNMIYFDPLFGINPWPPSSLLDPIGDPLLLTLPLDFEFLPPTDPTWIFQNVPLGNAAALAYLEANFGPIVPPPVFLTAIDILGTLAPII